MVPNTCYDNLDFEHMQKLGWAERNPMAAEVRFLMKLLRVQTKAARKTNLLGALRIDSCACLCPLPAPRNDFS